MTFEYAMSKLVTSHPNYAELRVEFKLNAIKNLINRGYAIVCPTEITLENEKAKLAPYKGNRGYFIMLPEHEIDKTVIKECFRIVCKELSGDIDALLQDMGSRFRVKVYAIEDVNW